MKILTPAEAHARIAAEPANIMLYGRPGTNKTTDAVTAFTHNGVCRALLAECEPGAAKPILARGLPMPGLPERTITTVQELGEVVQFAAMHRDRFDAVIVDTLSAWNANVVAENERKATKNKYSMWTETRDAMFALRTYCRSVGLHIVYIAHDQPQWMDERGNRYPGGPKMQPKTAIQEFVGGVDTILRVETIQKGAGFERVYFTGGEVWPMGYGLPPADLQAWYAKNRDGVNDSVVRADLGAYLRLRKPPYLGFENAT